MQGFEENSYINNELSGQPISEVLIAETADQL